jgi:hypothetical protein
MRARIAAKGPLELPTVFRASSFRWAKEFAAGAPAGWPPVSISSLEIECGPGGCRDSCSDAKSAAR